MTAFAASEEHEDVTVEQSARSRFALSSGPSQEKEAGFAPETASREPLTPKDLAEMDLIRRAQRGDQAAFSQIMDQYRERVTRYILHMVGNREDANDLSQEAFIRVYRALDRFDFHRPFSPWLYRIAHNVVLDHFRRRKARPVMIESNPEHPFEEGPDENAVDPQKALASREMSQAVRAAIQALPENYRSVMVFRYLDDLSYSDIAEALGITEANVMMRISRARRMLHDKLKHLYVR